jgi:hypothetical protein
MVTLFFFDTNLQPRISLLLRTSMRYLAQFTIPSPSVERRNTIRVFIISFGLRPFHQIVLQPDSFV